MGLRNRYLFQEESCFFVTTTFNQWLHLMRNHDYYVLVADSLNFVCKKYQTDLLGYVIMPNHVHLILYFTDKNRLSDLMRDFKKFTSGEIRRKLEAEQEQLLIAKLSFEHREQKFKVWQDRFDDVCIKSKKVLETKLDYIHTNPLQAHWNLATQPALYKYSSAGFYETGDKDLLDVVHYGAYF